MVTETTGSQTYGDSILDGGAGDDVLSAYANSSLSGGAGNDTLSAYDNATLEVARVTTFSALRNSTLSALITSAPTTIAPRH